MSLEADLLIDRRKIRRKLTFWRGAAIVVFIFAALALAAQFAGEGGVGKKSAPHVAKINLNGFISYDQKMLDELERVEKNNSAKALLLYVDSPGGSTAGSEALYNALRRVAAKKPVIAQIGALGASGAYIAAMGADQIISTETSLVGSIGVIIQWAEADRLLQTVGVRFQEVKTSPLKANPNGYEPASEEARAALKSLVDDSYAWFKNLVTTRRKIEGDLLTKVTDGRVFTGRQALDLKLVDALGDEKTARNWLEKEKNISSTLPDVLYRPHQDGMPPWLSSLAQAAGLGSLIPSLFSELHNSSTKLDGLVSVWHP